MKLLNPIDHYHALGWNIKYFKYQDDEDNNVKRPTDVGNAAGVKDQKRDGRKVLE